MKSYKSLDRQIFESGDYKLVPIRSEDRYDIMNWRNEQISHLRQAKPLSRSDQDYYFENIVDGLFDQDQPNQLLFSFLKKDVCIGYGGLVHIDWVNNNAEISFLMDTSFQKDSFVENWVTFLSLIKIPAFKYLKFRKIYTYAFDIRPQLYTALEAAGFTLEARLMDHCMIDKEYRDVLYHALFNPMIDLKFRDAIESDAELLWKWRNDPEVRMNSINIEEIPFENHLKWFSSKLDSKSSKTLIFHSRENSVGQVRIDKEENEWIINFSVDKAYRGLGLGKRMIHEVVQHFPELRYRAFVKEDNYSSNAIFKSLGFELKGTSTTEDNSILFEYILAEKSSV